jgi:hypothetical protein
MIKRRISDIGLREGISFLIMICLLAFSSNYVFAEESNQIQLPEIDQSDIGSNAHPDTSEIEREIYNLNAPLDAEKISWIYNAISKCSDEEQEQLNKVLDSKMEDLFKNNAAPQEFDTKSFPSLEDSTQYEQPADYESIVREIDALKLGKDAAVEDLRTRDKIIAAVSGISDPKLRYDLLDYMNKKERNAN